MARARPKSPAQTPPPPLMIVGEVVVLKWTKLSRGMPGAARRAAVPMAFPLTSFGKEESPVLIERISVNENDGFVPHSETFGLPADDTFKEDSVYSIRFNVRDGIVSVKFRDDLKTSFAEGRFGGPRSIGVDGQLFELPPGAVGTFMFNRRWLYKHGTIYVEHRFHFHATKLVEPKVFVRRTPDFLVDKRRILF